MYGFSDNCICIGLPQFFLLYREYLSPAVDVLTDAPKI